jgi:hypothetical protein
MDMYEEFFLPTAKKPESVERIAKLIGYKGPESFDAGFLYLGLDGELHAGRPKEVNND